MSVANAISQDAATTATASAATGSASPLTPNGAAQAYLSDVENRVYLSRFTSEVENGDWIDDYSESIDTKGLTQGCRPAFWRDNTSLVCDLNLITFTSDYSSVVKAQELVPANDRSNGAPIRSADGKSFAFISEGEGGKLALFRSDFAAGGSAQPKKIADLEAPLDSASDHVETLVRWN
ncbi:hypothetical protein ACFU53_23795 [Streptomyces sp. NPDC057474]|uniref:hypothetical protein n=1 Tax=Streptomyces sp. NPDC057474 TaxID=3346144 RepID=UPI0036CAB604